MDVVICSTISKSCLHNSTTSSDFALHHAERHKFNKDHRNREPLKLLATQRFIPLALNQSGRRGPYFEAILREQASLLIKRASGCRLFQGSLAIPPTIALAKVLFSWGARLIWTAQREHDAQIIKAAVNHKLAESFISSTMGIGSTT
jgi:hypothetical protein